MSTVVRRSVWQRAQSGHLESWQEYVRQGGPQAPERRESWVAILSEVEKRIPIRSGEKILDIGCGLDTVLDFVDRDVLGFTVDSLTASLAPLGLSPRAAHTAGALEGLPFRDDAFDRVVLLNVLDHVRGCALRSARDCQGPWHLAAAWSSRSTSTPVAATRPSASTNGGPAPDAPRPSTPWSSHSAPSRPCCTTPASTRPTLSTSPAPNPAATSSLPHCAKSGAGGRAGAHFARLRLAARPAYSRACGGDVSKTGP